MSGRCPRRPADRRPANRSSHRPVLACGAPRIAPAPCGFLASEIAVVANAEAATVALVDVESRSILGVIDVNPARTKAEGPGKPNFAQDTDVSPDGRTLYVSRGYLGDVAAFDIATGRLLWQRSLNTGRADHMTLTPDGRSLFVSAMLDNRVYKIATATGEIAGHLVTGVYPHDVKVSKDGRLLYNSSLGPLAGMPRSASAPPLTETPGFPFQLTIADVDTLAISDRIRLDTAFRPWQFSADEQRVYAQLSNQHAVVSYDMATRKVDRRLELPVKPGVTVADWDFEAPHHGLAPDGRRPDAMSRWSGLGLRRAGRRSRPVADCDDSRGRRSRLGGGHRRRPLLPRDQHARPRLSIIRSPAARKSPGCRWARARSTSRWRASPRRDRRGEGAAQTRL